MTQKYRSVGELVGLDSEGWLRGSSVRQTPCSNRDERPEGVKIDSIVVHCISLPERGRSARYPIDLFLNRIEQHVEEFPELAELEGLRVSSHFLIDRGGVVHQFVSCLDRAWHAGESAAMMRSKFNDFSIGIELLGDVYSPYTDTQMQVLQSLITTLRTRYPLRYGFAHSEIAPTRKSDPGQFFSWEGVRRPDTFELV